jgi:DNA-binding transcriptional ArsR family regulator
MPSDHRTYSHHLSVLSEILRGMLLHSVNELFNDIRKRCVVEWFMYDGWERILKEIVVIFSYYRRIFLQGLRKTTIIL